MAIEKGDLVYIDFVGIVKETGEVFDTTIEEEARKAGILDERQKYRPVLIAIGKSWAVEGLEEALVGRDENEHFEVEVPPEKGFGYRDPKKIQIYTRRKLMEAGIRGDLRPGSAVVINNTPAIVRAVSGGRYLLDFNPPLAGKTLVYKVWVRKICKNLEDKIKALIEKYLGEEMVEKIIYNVIEGGCLELSVQGGSMDSPELIRNRSRLVSDVFDIIKEIREIRFIETFKREEEQAEKTTK